MDASVPLLDALGGVSRFFSFIFARPGYLVVLCLSLSLSLISSSYVMSLFGWLRSPHPLAGDGQIDRYIPNDKLIDSYTDI